MAGWGGQSSDRLSQTPSPSCTQARTSFLSHLLLSHSLSLSFHRLSGGQKRPNRLFPSQRVKPQQEARIGRPDSDPKYPAITRANGSTMPRRRKKGHRQREGEGRGPLKTYLYMLKKMLMCPVKNRGDFGDSLEYCYC